MSEIEQTQSPASEPPPQPGLRFLETAVYIMGGLLVLMLVVLIGGIAWKALRRPPPEPPATNIVDVPLSAGASVASMTLDGDRLAVQTTSNGQTEILVLDTRKGLLISRVRLKPAQ